MKTNTCYETHTNCNGSECNYAKEYITLSHDGFGKPLWRVAHKIVPFADRNAFSPEWAYHCGHKAKDGTALATLIKILPTQSGDEKFTELNHLIEAK